MNDSIYQYVQLYKSLGTSKLEHVKVLIDSRLSVDEVVRLFYEQYCSLFEEGTTISFVYRCRFIHMTKVNYTILINRNRYED